MEIYNQKPYYQREDGARVYITDKESLQFLQKKHTKLSMELEDIERQIKNYA